ncbi:MAG: glycerol-3-phosphate 1-O-acyltransferase PlsY [Bryobacterales bacterium]|nr:glycerol-3-phosphate 1-O-acyltransferase PlsY [Bryobacteraceae bacterium]MDW8129077.1 glycerol-3-phosphate 1-O-acyltransferase PlsY [Bryobacterales bacterium]
MMEALAAIGIAYLLGAIPFGYLMVKWCTGRDVRTMGSGNIGATNVLRTTGRLPGIVTLLLDVAKGYVAVMIAAQLGNDSPVLMSGAALAAMAGHGFPVFLRFRGGKAVATFLGAFLYLAPAAVLAALVVFVIVVWRTRYISMGSIVASGTFPLAVWLIVHPPWAVIGAAVASGAFIIWRHQENIRRLRAGTENVFSWKGRRN